MISNMWYNKWQHVSLNMNVCDAIWNYDFKIDDLWKEHVLYEKKFQNVVRWNLRSVS